VGRDRLGAALLVGLLMALVGVLVAVQVHKLERRSGPLGLVLKGLEHLWVFGTAAMLVFGTAFLLFFLFSVKFKEWGPDILKALSETTIQCLTVVLI
jgi:hypothetical protein